MKWKTPKAGPLRLSLSAMQVGNICGIDFMAHGPQVCHCEEAVGRRGNLGKALPIGTDHHQNATRQLRLQRRSSSALYRGIQRKESTGAPQQGSTAVRTVCFCFHYDGSRKNVNKIFKKSSAERVEKFVRKPAANFIGRNKSPEFYVTFRIVTRCVGVNKITQPEMR